MLRKMQRRLPHRTIKAGQASCNSTRSRTVHTGPVKFSNLRAALTLPTAYLSLRMFFRMLRSASSAVLIALLWTQPNREKAFRMQPRLWPSPWSRAWSYNYRDHDQIEMNYSYSNITASVGSPAYSRRLVLPAGHVPTDTPCPAARGRSPGQQRCPANLYPGTNTNNRLTKNLRACTPVLRRCQWHLFHDRDADAMVASQLPPWDRYAKGAPCGGHDATPHAILPITVCESVRVRRYTLSRRYPRTRRSTELPRLWTKHQVGTRDEGLLVMACSAAVTLQARSLQVSMIDTSSFVLIH